MPCVVLRNLDIHVTSLYKLVGVNVVGTSQEGIEFGGDVLQAQVDSRSALVNNGIDFATRHLSGERIALDVNIDDSILIFAGLGLWNLDASTSALANLLDLGTLAADDVGADGGGNGNVDRLLL